MTVPYEKLLAKLPPERQRKIKARAAELIAEEYALRDLRKAKHLHSRRRSPSSWAAGRSMSPGWRSGRT